MQVAPTLQETEMTLIFLEVNPLFNASKLEEFQQPLLPGTIVISEDSILVSTSLTSELQKQRDVFADNEDSEKACKELIESKIDKDVFSLNGDVIKGESYLTMR